MTSYEVEGRWQKATKLAARLHAHDIHASQVVRITRDQWKQLALVAGELPPSDTTILVITGILRAFEEAKAERDAAAANMVFDPATAEVTR